MSNEPNTPKEELTAGSGLSVRLGAAENMDWRNNLSDLPDFDKACLIYETLPTGETVIHRKIIPFVKCEPMKGSDPVAFTDKDGAWFVVYGHEGGPHKSRV